MCGPRFELLQLAMLACSHLPLTVPITPSANPYWVPRYVFIMYGQRSSLLQPTGMSARERKSLENQGDDLNLLGFSLQGQTYLK